VEQHELTARAHRAYHALELAWLLEIAIVRAACEGFRRRPLSPGLHFVDLFVMTKPATARGVEKATLGTVRWVM